MSNKKFNSIRVNGETIDVQDVNATTEINNLKEKNTSINSQLNTIENELGRNGDGSKITLQTTAQNIRGAINEVNTQFKDIAELFTTEQTETLFKIKCNGKVIANIPIGGGNTQVTSYTITNTLTNCSSNNRATSITENSSYNATITANNRYTLSTATITMGGVDITSSAYNNGVINIRQVTGNIVITVNAIETTTPVEPPVDPNLDGLLKNRLLV